MAVKANPPPAGWEFWTVQASLVITVASVVAAEINRDIPIWQHKRYLDRPALGPGEGSIGRYRKWTRQFYSPPDQVPAANSEPATQVPAANSEPATLEATATATLEAKTF